MENPANSKSPPMPYARQTLSDTVQQQLFKMLARNLDYAPSAADLPAVIQVMIEDLRRHGLSDGDSDRVAEAFCTLGPHLQKWPTSRMVIESLPGSRAGRSTRLLMPPTPLDSYCDEYLRTHPGATKKDACLEYLRQKQLLKHLPESVSVDDEARAERDAIQSEGT